MGSSWLNHYQRVAFDSLTDLVIRQNEILKDDDAIVAKALEILSKKNKFIKRAT